MVRVYWFFKKGQIKKYTLHVPNGYICINDIPTQHWFEPTKRNQFSLANSLFHLCHENNFSLYCTWIAGWIKWHQTLVLKELSLTVLDDRVGHPHGFRQNYACLLANLTYSLNRWRTSLNHYFLPDYISNKWIWKPCSIITRVRSELAPNSTPWRMDGKWSWENSCLLASSSLANHGLLLPY